MNSFCVRSSSEKSRKSKAIHAKMGEIALCEKNVNIVHKSSFVQKSLKNVSSSYTAKEITEHRREQVKLKMHVAVHELLSGKRKVKTF